MRTMRSWAVFGGGMFLIALVTWAISVRDETATSLAQRTRGTPPGLARVKLSGKWGYIDRSGRIVINPQFEEAGDFSEGLARVKMGGKWGYIDRTGRFLINPQFEEAGDFSQGLARVKLGGKWGYVDRRGEIVISPQFSEASDFSRSL